MGHKSLDGMQAAAIHGQGLRGQRFHDPQALGEWCEGGWSCPEHASGGKGQHCITMQPDSHSMGELARQFEIHPPVQIGADEIRRLWHHHPKVVIVVKPLAKGQHRLSIRQQALEQLVEPGVTKVGFFGAFPVKMQHQGFLLEFRPEMKQ